mmetsp:Transcript_40183/g.60881  ORF Transcript_40183/g.60881 Transcript_40183/m.60881 type:complete len:184 (+) Transcript_40183:2677-3228(+)
MGMFTHLNSPSNIIIPPSRTQPLLVEVEVLRNLVHITASSSNKFKLLQPCIMRNSMQQQLLFMHNLIIIIDLTVPMFREAVCLGTNIICNNLEGMEMVVMVAAVEVASTLVMVGGIGVSMRLMSDQVGMEERQIVTHNRLQQLLLMYIIWKNFLHYGDNEMKYLFRVDSGKATFIFDSNNKRF